MGQKEEALARNLDSNTVDHEETAAPGDGMPLAADSKFVFQPVQESTKVEVLPPVTAAPWHVQPQQCCLRDSCLALSRPVTLQHVGHCSHCHCATVLPTRCAAPGTCRPTRLASSCRDRDVQSGTSPKDTLARLPCHGPSKRPHDSEVTA